MSKIAGVDILVTVESAVPGTFTTVGGQKGAKLNRKVSTFETTSKDSAGWKEFLASFKEWSVDCDGFVVATDAGYALLDTHFNAGTNVNVKFTLDGKAYTGSAIITDFPLEMPQDDAVTFSLTLQGTGALTEA